MPSSHAFRLSCIRRTVRRLRAMSGLGNPMRQKAQTPRRINPLSLAHPLLFPTHPHLTLASAARSAGKGNHGQLLD